MVGRLDEEERIDGEAVGVEIGAAEADRVAPGAAAVDVARLHGGDLAAAMRSGRMPVMLRPLSVTEPSVGVYTPVIMLKAVVLPAPLGPMSATIS